MNKDGCQRVEPVHLHAVKCVSVHKDNGRQLVEAAFRAALERERAEKQGQRVERSHSDAVVHGRVLSLLPCESPRGVHHTELPEAWPGEPFADEWNTYRREIGRWLAEGLEGRHVLIAGTEILGIYDTSEEARAVGLKRCLLQPFFVHPIRPEEPYLHIRGISYPWPASHSA